MNWDVQKIVFLIGLLDNTAWGEGSGRSGVLEPDRTRKSMAGGSGE